MHLSAILLNGLRDYGTALWDGGDAACDHSGRKNSGDFEHRPGNGGEVFRSGSRYINQGEATGRVCGKCGARRIDRQIGLEPTPDAYIATMVAVFRQIRRVMRDDATAWINLGDSFRDKQLLMMPARLALALQADGWWLRSDIIWAKPNPMPESCTDRPTCAHEHVFLLTRSARYFYDADAVREPPTWAAPTGTKNGAGRERNAGGRTDGYTRIAEPGGVGCPEGGRNLRNVWTIATAPFSEWGETSRQVRVAWDADVDGKKRKASPDCPVHGDQAVPAPNAHGDAHAADYPDRTARSYIDPVQAPVDGSAPTGLHHEQAIESSMLDWLDQQHSEPATLHSSQSHRTARAAATSLSCSPCAETGDGTERTSAERGETGLADHTLASSIWQDGSDDRPLVQTDDRSVDMSSCCCEWYIEKTEKTSHFATYPPTLVERCIRAGTSERGCCAACGAPWVRMTERTPGISGEALGRPKQTAGMWDGSSTLSMSGHHGAGWRERGPQQTTTGWRVSCQCNAEVVPATILDPFLGSGTTALVADRLQRHCIGIDLSTTYADLARNRIEADAPLFTSWAPAEPPEDERMRDLFAEAAE